MYRLFLLKRWVEDLLMFPLILLGRFLARRRPLGREYETFFFFPFYHIGGAEKVHAAIAKATGNPDCIIFFTRKSQNDLFYKEFQSSGCVMKDISRYTDNKWIYFVNIIFRGIISGYINSQKKKPLVFNGQCNFGYKISPWIKKDIAQIELIHSLCSFSYIRIPFLPFITRTVMISTIRIREHLDLYKRFGIPLSLGERIQFIMNGIELPERTMTDNRPPITDEGHQVSDKRQLQNEKNGTPEDRSSVVGDRLSVVGYRLTVLYVGRGTAEKRVDLIAEMAKRMHGKEENITFQFLGEVKDSIPADLHGYSYFWGNQGDPEKIDSIYRKAQVLILVSDTEGFPMVVMEAMARGLAVVSTAVGEVPLHVQDGVNGYLVRDFRNREAVVEECMQYILHLHKDQGLLSQIAERNIDYAYKHFGMDRFRREYNELFDRMRTAHSI
jgi:glycosyltransferase involved in cell wall biosynthesis